MHPIGKPHEARSRCASYAALCRMKHHFRLLKIISFRIGRFLSEFEDCEIVTRINSDSAEDLISRHNF